MRQAHGVGCCHHHIGCGEEPRPCTQQHTASSQTPRALFFSIFCFVSPFTFTCLCLPFLFHPTGEEGGAGGGEGNYYNNQSTVGNCKVPAWVCVTSTCFNSDTAEHRGPLAPHPRSRPTGTAPPTIVHHAMQACCLPTVLPARTAAWAPPGCGARHLQEGVARIHRRSALDSREMLPPQLFQAASHEAAHYMHSTCAQGSEPWNILDSAALCSAATHSPPDQHSKHVQLG
jgi:hypothetical protein